MVASKLQGGMHWSFPALPGSERMHDTVIGLLVNKIEFKRDIHTKLQVWPIIVYLSKSRQGASWNIKKVILE